MERKRYFKKFDVEEALEIWGKALFENKWLERKHKEVISVKDALMRLTAEPIFAKKSVPNYVSSAMDGVAVKSANTRAASEKSPLKLTEGEDYFWLNTGECLPQGFDAVVMAEFVREISPNEVEIYSPVAPFENVRLLGEDCEFNEMIYTSNHLLIPEDLSFLLSAGVESVAVYKKPRVVIIPTGSEIVEEVNTNLEGKIPETNSYFITNELGLLGAEVQVSEVVPDDPKIISEKFKSLSGNFDFIVSIAGSSKGSRDFTAHFLEENGMLLVHGVNMRPGKPIILGFFDGVPFVGLPGYPQAAFNDLEYFVLPYISRWTGIHSPEYTKINASLALRVVCVPGEKHIYHGITGKVSGKYWFYPLKNLSSAISSITKSNSKIVISRSIEGINEGENIEIYVKKQMETIDNNIIFAGSHDLLIDIIAELMKVNFGKEISVFSLGSLLGLETLRKKRSHFTGIHMLDEKTGEYNVPFLKDFSKDAFTLINLSYRSQGLIVKKGNPRHIKSLKSLILEDIKFVNRQKGSGTRILLEYLLKKEAIDKNLIKGFDDIEYTHLGVGAKIYYGLADVGVGIRAVVDAFELDFIPLCEERYDLLFSNDFLDNNKEILTIIKSSDFKAKVNEFSGYDLRDSGKEVW
jgi:putative molybdopterin biosynthesis protein